MRLKLNRLQIPKFQLTVESAQQSGKSLGQIVNAVVTGIFEWNFIIKSTKKRSRERNSPI